IGMFSGGPVPGEGYSNPEWAKFTTDVPNANIFTLLYYQAAKSLFLALDEVDGDLGADHANLRAALKGLDWTGPGGNLKLDANNQAIVDNFIVEVQEGPYGNLITVQVAEANNAKQCTVAYQRFDNCSDLG